MGAFIVLFGTYGGGKPPPYNPADAPKKMLEVCKANFVHRFVGKGLAPSAFLDNAKAFFDRLKASRKIPGWTSF